MSAFVMSQNEIAPIVEFCVQHKIAFLDGGGYRQAARDNANRLGQVLLAANVESVNYRYKESAKVPRYVHTRPDTSHAAYFLAKVSDAVECLDYQSCETPTWTQSEAHAILARVNGRLVRMLSQRVGR